MKTNTYVVHPRILNKLTEEEPFHIKWEMEQINKGKIRWIPTFIGLALITFCLAAPIVVWMKGAEMFPVILMSLVFGPVAIWATNDIMRNNKTYKEIWQNYRYQISDFYGEFSMAAHGPLTHNEVVQEVQKVLVDLAKQIITGNDDQAEKEARKELGRKFDIAREFLREFDGRKGYNFFFEEAGRELNENLDFVI